MRSDPTALIVVPIFIAVRSAKSFRKEFKIDPNLLPVPMLRLPMIKAR